MAFLSGKNGKVTFGGSAFKVKRWRVNLKVQLLDVTNSESSGSGEYIAGVKDADIEVDADYDYGSAPLAVLYPGASVAGIFYVNSPSAGTLSGTVILEESPVQSEVRGTVSLNLRGKITGGYTITSA